MFLLYTAWNTNGEYVNAAFDIDPEVEGLQQVTFVAAGASNVMNFKFFEPSPECFVTGFVCLENSDCCSDNCGADGLCAAPSSQSYFIGFEHRGCAGMNELGVIAKQTVEECAEACDALANCLSFEYRQSTKSCQLSSSCSYDLSGLSDTDWNYYVSICTAQIFTHLLLLAILYPFLTRYFDYFGVVTGKGTKWLSTQLSRG